MRKPKVGEKLFLVDAGNRIRRGLGEQRECVVSKVGRKYFYVKETDDSWSEIQFYIEDWVEKTDFTRSYKLYENRQVWEDDIIAHKYRDLLRHTFDYGGSGKFTLDQLQKAAEILGLCLE